MFNKVNKQISKEAEKKDKEDTNAFKEEYEKLCDKHRIRVSPVLQYSERGITAGAKLERMPELPKASKIITPN